MEIGLNDCHICGKDTGAGMCGFDTDHNGKMLLVCIDCKVKRDGPIAER